MANARATTLVIGTAGLLLACTGGPSAWDGMSLGPEGASSTYEQPPDFTDDPSPGPTSGQAGSGSSSRPGSNDSDDPSGSSSSSGSSSDCPPCGSYTCTAPGGGPGPTLRLTQQQNGGCGFVAGDQGFVLECGGKVTDGKGNTVGSWTASGNNVTLNNTGGSSSTCTVGGASTDPAPTPDQPPDSDDAG